MPDLRRVETKLRCAELLVNALLPGIDVYSPGFDLQGFIGSIQKARVSDSSSSLHNSLISIAKLGQGNSIGVSNEIDEETGLPRGSILPTNKYPKLSYLSAHHRPNSPSNSSNGVHKHISTPTADDSEGNVLNTLYSPQSAFESPENPTGSEIKIILPPKHVASELIEAVWDNACVLFRFYHRPSFIRDLDLLYETDPDDYTNKQYKILPLVYSVLAVGVLFSMDKSDRLGFKDASEGYKYFVAARKLIDIADARDTYAIQSIVMMIIFLQCSARLSTCYSYIGVALRSALRAGLHRKVAYNFNPIELETRKRLFWTIRKMDIYVNAMLGLPRSIAEEDIDQELPEEIDDENITEDGYFPQKKGKISSAGIANAHTRLITILSHIMKYIYPVKQESESVSCLTGDTATAPLYNVTHAKVAEMEDEILQWLESLPAELRPGAIPPPEYLKANQLLHLALCHIQIVLYRPFIHYCSPKFSGDEKARASALSCIKVSRTAMHIAHDLVSKKLLNGAYWFSIYTIFFSVACLVYYVHENPGDAEALEIRQDAELGKNALTSLKDSSMAAQRTYNLLNTLFEQLNRRTANISGSGSETPLSASQSTATPPSNTINGQNASNFIHSVASGVFPSNLSAANNNNTKSTTNNTDSTASQIYSNVSNTNSSLQHPIPTKGKRGRPPNSVRRISNRTPSTSNIPAGISKPLNNGTSIGMASLGDMRPPSRNSSAASTPATSTNMFNVPNRSQTISPASSHFANDVGLNSNLPRQDLGLDRTSDDIFSGLPSFGLDSVESNTSAAININAQNGDNSSLKNPVTTESPHFYVPGIMDQVDAQLFGRFLPPYMLQQSQAMPLGVSSGPHMSESLGTKSVHTNSNGFDVTLDSLMGSDSRFGNDDEQATILEKSQELNSMNESFGEKTAKDGNSNSNDGNKHLINDSNIDANGGIEPFNSELEDRRLSLSTLFSKGWEELIGQHNELSGLNSFMTQ